MTQETGQETTTETYLRLLTCSRASLFASNPTSSPSAPPAMAFNVDPVDAFDWLKPLRPVARVGASLRLY